MTQSKRFLISLDLEDPRLFSVEGLNYPSRVERNTLFFLDLLSQHKWPATFFTVGHIFKNEPQLIEKLIEKGFEIGWHTEAHRPIVQMTESEFGRDLALGRQYAQKFGFEMVGFRAPIFSVNHSIPWFHKVLKDNGFIYSSSVLPEKNPLYGWPGFPQHPVLIDDVVEIPMSIIDLGVLRVPLGGTYLRLLPNWLLQAGIANSKNEDLTTYIHPYDFDWQQERYLHGGVNGSFILNFLMYYNRKKAGKKFEAILGTSALNPIGYREYASQLLKSGIRSYE